MPANKQLADQTFRHSLHIEGIKADQIGQFGVFLRQLDETTQKKLGGKNLTEYSRARFDAQHKAITEALASIFDEYQTTFAKELLGLGKYEAEFEAKSITYAINAEAIAAIPSVAMIKSAIFTQPLQVEGISNGDLLDPFIRDLKTKELRRITNTIRTGYSLGQTNQEMVRAIRGTRSAKYRDGILSVTTRSAEAIVRTAVQHVSNTARMAVWENNPGIVEKYVIVATLDSRTTTTCMNLDGQEFEIGKGPKPPFHIRCRTTTRAKIVGKYAGIEEQFNRANKFPNKSGITGNTTYYEALKMQPAKFQDEVLGPKRGKLFRDGGLSPEEFAKLNMGRDFQPLTIEEMRLKEPSAFERADL